jgi:hypothetical protein
VILSQECEQRQEGIEERANSWKDFSNKKDDVGANYSSVSDSSVDASKCVNNRSNPNINDHDQAHCVSNNSSQTACCYTCNRQFSSVEHLHRHEEQSELHRKNILKIIQDS